MTDTLEDVKARASAAIKELRASDVEQERVVNPFACKLPSPIDIIAAAILQEPKR